MSIFLANIFCRHTHFYHVSLVINFLKAYSFMKIECGRENRRKIINPIDKYTNFWQFFRNNLSQNLFLRFKSICKKAEIM